MWNHRYLTRIDWRIVPIIFALMIISLLVISATDPAFIKSPGQIGFFTPKVQSQIQRFFIGWAVYIFFAGVDYNKIREWAWILYVLMLISLIGLFFAPAIQNVHRWYRIPLFGVSIQPSEYSKLIVVIALSWFLEKSSATAASWQTTWQGLLIAGIPFLLIVKQPDLGTALVLCPHCDLKSKIDQAIEEY